MIRLCELESNQGNIAKKYYVDSDGTYKVNSAATIYDATARNIELNFNEVSDYLDALASEMTKCMVLGVCGATGETKKLVTNDKAVAGESIARTKDHFDWANGGSVSLLMLDFDGAQSDKLRQQFLRELDCVLSDALIGKSAVEREQICKWVRPSTSASVSINGKSGTGLHVFIPVKKCNDDLIKLIHRFCWLTSPEYRGYKLTAAGTVMAESLIDPAVGSRERVVYTSDAQVEGDGAWDKIERKCKMEFGGIIDAEIATELLRELTVDFDIEWAVYKREIESSPDIIAAKKAWKDSLVAARVEAGQSTSDAKKSVASLSEGILLSNELLLRNDGSLVSVREILEQPDVWIGQNKFADPIKKEQHRNVGMILGAEEAPFLNSMSHGGIKYRLKWAPEDLTEWIESASDDEIEDWFGIHMSNCSCGRITGEKIMKLAAKKMDVTVTAFRAEVKDASKTQQDAADEAVSASQVGSDATHGDIIDDYLRRVGECRGYGEGLYVWNGGTVWKHQTAGYIQKQLRGMYNHCDKCSRVSDYKGLSRAIVDEDGIKVDRWMEAEGFPCSDGFYTVSKSGHVRQEYSKELNCRFKMGLKPDFDMKTPYFDKVIANTDNPVLYQQLFGLILGGYLPALQMAAVLFGQGGTGKGTTEDVLSAMLPKKRLTSMKLEQMNDSKYVIQLADARVNFTSEVKRKKIDLTGAKQVIGGGLITGRALFSDPVQFYSNCAFVISFNHFFPLSSIGSDIERRFGHSIVKFTARQDKQVVGLSDLIIANELPGVLAWAMEGVRLFFEFGIEDSLSLEVFQRWIAGVDPVALFVEEHIGKGRGKGLLRSEVWTKFKLFCEDGLYARVNKGEFMEDIEKSIGSPVRTRDGYRFRNCMWKTG